MTTSSRRKVKLLWMFPSPGYMGDGVATEDDNSAIYSINPSLKLVTYSPTERLASMVAFFAVTLLAMAGWMNSTSKPGDPRFDLYLMLAGVILLAGTANILRSSVRIEWDERSKELIINRRWLWTWTIVRVPVSEASLLMLSMTFIRFPIAFATQPRRIMLTLVLKDQCFIVGGYGSVDQASEAGSRLERRLGSLSYRWNEVKVFLWTAMYFWFLGLFDTRYSVLIRGASAPTGSPSEFRRFDNPDAI